MNFNTCMIEASKHFVLKYMKRWDWDFADLRDALRGAYKVEKVGKKKYEAYIRKGGSRRIVYIYEFDTVFVITGSEGG